MKKAVRHSTLAVRCILLLTCTLLALAVRGQSEGPVGKPLRSAKPPALPRIERHACPFECCTFREWTVTEASDLYDNWQQSRKKIGKLPQGAKVQGLDGIYITFFPDRVRATRDYPEEGIKAGDEFLRYMYVGEGSAQFWFNGKFDTLSMAVSGSECYKGCAAELLAAGKKEWWVQVKTSDGKLGWVLAHGNFDGMDACS